MSAAVDKVMQFVERELKKNPQVSNQDLFKGAKKINRAVARLTPRQFHAKYPLQVKRKKASGRTRRKTTRSAAASRSVGRRTSTRAVENTEGVRKVMLRFAKDLSSADSQTQTIEVLSNMDRYVADIMKACRN